MNCGPVQWNDGFPATDWVPICEQVGNMILSYGVGWLIFVDGGDTPFCNNCFYSESELGEFVALNSTLVNLDSVSS